MTAGMAMATPFGPNQARHRPVATTLAAVLTRRLPTSRADSRSLLPRPSQTRSPIIGRAHVGYLPTGRVVGISKLARVVDVFARRFQVQEKMTAEIARCINDVLQPQGVGVVIEAAHECMTTRGIHKRGVSMITSKMLGSFRSDARTRNEFLTFIDIRDRR